MSDSIYKYIWPFLQTDIVILFCLPSDKYPSLEIKYRSKKSREKEVEPERAERQYSTPSTPEYRSERRRGSKVMWKSFSSIVCAVNNLKQKTKVTVWRFLGEKVCKNVRGVRALQKDRGLCPVWLLQRHEEVWRSKQNQTEVQVSAVWGQGQGECMFTLNETFSYCNIQSELISLRSLIL